MPQSVIDALDHNDIQNTDNKKIPHFILASNKQALQAADERAKRNNLDSMIISESMTTDVQTVHSKILKYLMNCNADCLIFGGECTVFVKKAGRGGRNQHLVRVLTVMRL